MVILVANILNFVFNLLTNFLLPKYLTIDAYAQIKSFLLYVSYVGILHLGYSDGMYLRYGGRNLREINRREIATDISTMRLTQLIIAIIAFALSIITKDSAIIACTLTIVPINMANYFRFLLQATGEFKNYAKIMNLTTIVTAIGVLLLLAFRCFAQDIWYLALYVIVDVFVWLLLERLFRGTYNIDRLENQKCFDLSLLMENIKMGFFLMLGTFSSIILTGMDRWFIKALMDNTAFAMYSFAVSLEGLMNVVVSPISTTLYNYFCHEQSKESLESLRGKVNLFAATVISCAFPAKFILEIFLPNYLAAVQVMFLLFGAQMFYIIVRCIYVNLYKARKQQKIYFIKLTIVIVSGFILNVELYSIMHTKEAFALGTMLCGISWYALSVFDFKDIMVKSNEVVYLLLQVVAFLFCGYNFSALYGMVAYCTVTLLLAMLLMRTHFLSCLELAQGMIQKLKRKKNI